MPLGSGPGGHCTSRDVTGGVHGCNVFPRNPVARRSMQNVFFVFSRTLGALHSTLLARTALVSLTAERVILDFCMFY